MNPKGSKIRGSSAGAQSEISEASPTNIAYEGNYTLSLTSGSGAPASLQAPGWAVLQILPSEKYTMTGMLADGTPSTAGGPTGGLGLGLPLMIPIAISFDKGHATLGGELTLNPAASLTEPAPCGDGFGTLQWVKQNATGGFSETLGPTISQYAPAPAAALLSSSSCTLTIGSGSPIKFTINSRGAAIFPPATPGSPKLSFTPATGAFSGSFTPIGGHSTSFSGVILPNTAAGSGFILIDGSATPVSIAPAAVSD